MKPKLQENIDRVQFYPGKISGRARELCTSYPEFLDIGIMGRCDIGQSGVCLSSGIQCSQDGLHRSEPDMSFCNYKRIIDESKGRTSQVILGGRGDPDRHSYFAEILRYTRENGIIPNYITSGFHLNSEIVRVSKDFCGCVGVSFHNQFYTYRAINMLMAEGIKTNIFFVVSKSSINDAIRRLETNSFPEGINAVVFLLHKPVGLGSRNNVLEVKDERVKRFFCLLGWNTLRQKTGVDFCSSPGAINFLRHFNTASIVACEAGRRSAYISPGMRMMPCSFCTDCESWSYSISESTVENGWRSEPFARIRSILAVRCPECDRRRTCRGGCPIMPEIVLCDRKEREYGIN